MISTPFRLDALWIRGALALWALASLVGCVEIIDHGNTVCGPDTCQGCCNAQGVCEGGDTLFACGFGGGTCDRCSGAEACKAGVCTGSGNPDGGDKTTSCGPSTCAGCCSEGQCVALEDQSVEACGSGGGICGGCDSGKTCALGACVPKTGCVLTWSANANASGALIDFDVYPVGSAVTVNLQLQNRGTGTCEITAPTWIAGSDINAFSFAGQERSGFTLAPWEKASIPVTFSPYAVASWSEIFNGFTFDVNDDAPSQCASKERGCRRIGLKARGSSTGFAPVFAAARTSLDFGTVTVGCESAWRSVQFVNSGPSEVEITGAFVNGGGFSLEPVVLPLRVPAWGSAPLRVRYAPQAPGTHLGALTVKKGLDVVTVPLRGEANTSAQHTFTAEQASVGEIDVLFVVHRGTGMAPFQYELSQAASLITQKLSNRAGTFHLGVMTTDLTHAGAGRLQGSPRWIESGEDAAAQLSKNLVVGVSSSVPDQAFEALRVGLLAPNGTDPVRNGGFRRDGVRLAIVFVSNSVEKSAADTDDYARTLLGITGSSLESRQVQAFALAPAAECQSGRYAELVSRLNGNTDRCRPLVAGDMASQVRDIADGLLELQDTWVLPGPIDETRAVEVQVDGLAVAPPAWSLNPATGELAFAPGYAPEPGTLLTVGYTPVCHPSP